MATCLAVNLVPAVVLSTIVALAMVTTTATADAVASAPIPVKSPTVRAADGLRASLMRSDAAIAKVNLRLRVLSAQAGPLLSNLLATKTAQATAETDATLQSTRLAELGSQLQLARSALEHSAIDSYVGGGGPLLATVSYQVGLRAALFNQAESARSDQVTRSLRATSASKSATAAATTAAQAESTNGLHHRQPAAPLHKAQVRRDRPGRPGGQDTQHPAAGGNPWGAGF